MKKTIYRNKYDSWICFKNAVLKQINKYQFGNEEAFHNCMMFGYAVIEPVSEKYPKGVVIISNVYRDAVTIRA
ncbi:MAG: hypothetical protein IJT36_01685 [Alphaproteobacteria bacterium]|nr:hypothetical protein [Alphaproteobacteria bacterium]